MPCIMQRSTAEILLVYRIYKVTKLNYRLKIFGIVLFILLITGCASTNPSAQIEPEISQTESDGGKLVQINEDVLQHMMDGQLYLDQGDFAMAIIEFQEAQRIDPNIPSIYISLSECYWHLNKPERAMEYLDAALEIDPLNIEVLEFMAEQYFRLQQLDNAEVIYKKLSLAKPDESDYDLALGDLARLQKKYSTALDHYEAAYSKTADVIALELAADLSHRIRKFEKAEDHYNKLLKLDSLNVDYLSAFSDVKVQLGKAEDAVKMVRKVIEIEGSSIERQIQLGVLYGEVGKDDEAIETFTGLLDNDSTKATALHFLSTIYREKQDFDNAHKHAADLIELQPDNPQGYVNGALAALENDDPEAAIQILNPAAAEFPEEYLVQYLLGLSYHQIQNYELGSIFLDRARQIVPNSRNVLHLLAIANDNLNRWEISDGIYQQLIQTDSTDAQALNNYAYSMVERGINLQVSKEYARRAIEIAPDQAAYLDTYGWILYKLNKSKEALKYIQKSLEIDNTNAEILEHLGDVYLKLKKFEKAREAYQRSLKYDPENESLIKKLGDF